MRSTVLVLAATLLVLPRAAHAHFTLLAPPPASNSTNGGKGDPPCGPTDMPSNVVTPVMGGSKLTVKVNETVYHPGFYRIALALKSRSELPIDNVVYDSSGKVLPPAGPGNSATADFETNPVFPVLADNLWPHTSATAMFSGEITLPNVNCDKCTLQVIEFMASHGSNGAKAGYFYHHCADLKITADTSKPIFDPTAGSGAGGSSSTGGSAGSASGGTGSAAGGAAGGLAAGSGGSGVSTAGAPATAGGAPGVAGAAAAGAPAAGGSPGNASAGNGSSAAGAMGTPSTSGEADSGGCAVSTHRANSKPLLWGLLGLLLLGRRRARRG